VRDGAVVITGGVITWVGRRSELPDDFVHLPVERHRGVLTPGLVNAHTHLQYTGFAELGQQRFNDFEDWSAAFEVVYQAVADPDEWHGAARTGAVLARESGTTQLAEIVTDDAARGALADAGLRGIEYLEAIGEVEKNWEARGRDAFLARLAHDAGTPVGVSPHAPYSLDGRVIAELV
jgi:cytosine/adenosine deaminase-related metal-dependent hydrolase